MTPPKPLTDRLRRRVLWALPTGLYVIGSAGDEEGSRRFNLMTATLVMQVATDPKLVAVAVDVTAVTHRLIDGGGHFSVSVIAREDKAVVRRFVKPVETSAVERDSGGRPISMGGEAVTAGPSGCPVLGRAIAWLDCAVRSRLDFPSHTLFVGEVIGVDGPEGDVLDILRREDTRMSYGG